MNNLIYFDNAATGFPKPPEVKRAVMRSFREYGGNPGRSGHILSENASKIIYRCREKICELVNFDFPERVVLTPNATYALNFAIKGLANKGDNILISNFEHNSVYRPVYCLCNNSENCMSYNLFDASSPDDTIIVNNFLNSVQSNTKIAVVTAASNICGKVLPLKRISDICKNKNIKLIIDASQAMGHIEVNYKIIKPDVLCSAGHKGLYGPMGTGFAVFEKDINPFPIIEGGNGMVSELPVMGDELPEILEPGTLNVTGICGLEAGIIEIMNKSISYIESYCAEIENYISDKLKQLGAVIYSDFKYKTPIILFNIPGYQSNEVSSMLDRNGVCTRSGLHCSPLAHKALFTGEYGAVRISLGHFNTMDEAKKFIRIVERNFF